MGRIVSNFIAASAMLTLIAASHVVAAEKVKLTGAEITALYAADLKLTGKTETTGTTWVIQHFADGKREIAWKSTDGNTGHNVGSMKVEGDTLCTIFAGGEWNCFDVYKTGDNTYEVHNVAADDWHTYSVTKR